MGALKAFGIFVGLGIAMFMGIDIIVILLLWGILGSLNKGKNGFRRGGGTSSIYHEDLYDNHDDYESNEVGWSDGSDSYDCDCGYDSSDCDSGGCDGGDGGD